MHLFSSYEISRRLRSITIALFFCIVALPMGLTGNAFATTTPKQVSSIPTCKVVELHLHGKKRPTSQCLSQTSSAVTPNVTVDHPCNNTNDLVLYWNGPIYTNSSPFVIPPGPILCVWGSGDLDLAQGNQANNTNWNDQVTSWWAGCSGGTFFASDGAARWFDNREDFQGGNGLTAPSGNFDGNGFNGDMFNDSLTVIHLNSNCH